MANKFLWLGLGLLANIALAAETPQQPHQPAADDAGICHDKPQVSPQCRWIRGTLAIYNGTPPIRIKQRGTKKVLAIGPSEDEWMPADLKAKLTLDNAIDARLKICPFPKSRGLQVVCVDQAEIVRIIAAPN